MVLPQIGPRPILALPWPAHSAIVHSADRRAHGERHSANGFCLNVEILTGFVDDQGKALGGPAGVAIDKEGELLVADDVGNVHLASHRRRQPTRDTPVGGHLTSRKKSGADHPPHWFVESRPLLFVAAGSAA